MKIIIIALTVLIFASINGYTKEITDCSKIKKISPKFYLCKAGKLKNLKLNTENIKEKKYLSDWFKKKNDS